MKTLILASLIFIATAFPLAARAAFGLPLSSALPDRRAALRRRDSGPEAAAGRRCRMPAGLKIAIIGAGMGGLAAAAALRKVGVPYTDDEIAKAMTEKIVRNTPRKPGSISDTLR